MESAPDLPVTGWPQAGCLAVRDCPRSLRSGPGNLGRCLSWRLGCALQLSGHVPRQPRLQEVYGLPLPRQSSARRAASGSSRSEPRCALRSPEWSEINARRATRFTNAAGRHVQGWETSLLSTRDGRRRRVALRAALRRTTSSLCRASRFQPKPSICSASFSPRQHPDLSPHGPQVTGRHLLPSSPASRMPSWPGC